MQPQIHIDDLSKYKVVVFMIHNNVAIIILVPVASGKEDSSDSRRSNVLFMIWRSWVPTSGEL